MWLSLVISVVCVIFVFILMQRWVNRENTNSGANRNENERVGNPAYIYIYGLLLSQGSIMIHFLVSSLNKPAYVIGGPCKWVRLPFRFVAGAWALAAFVFVQAYASTLFMYLIVPYNPPLINSVYDIAKSTDINLMVKKSGTLDTLVSVYTINLSFVLLIINTYFIPLEH